MWNRKMYGSSRSLVRLVGSNLPISTGERLHIQLPHVPNSAVSSPVGPSRGSTDFPIDGITLAGLLQDSDDLLRGQLRPTHLAPILEDSARGDGEDESGIVMTGGGEDDDESVEGRHTESEGATRRRISALEAELAGLRAHIAAYALADLQENVQAAPPPAPPPPPPPPVLNPEMSVSTTTTTGDVPSVLDGPVPPPATPSSARPDMSSMFHQLSAIKLRAVEKSPGGTPQRHTQSHQQPPAIDDPAAIIAHALRKKFSHRVFQDSPDRDNLNRSYDSSGFNSPATKLFEQSPQSSEDK